MSEKSLESTLERAAAGEDAAAGWDSELFHIFIEKIRDAGVKIEAVF